MLLLSLVYAVLLLAWLALPRRAAATEEEPEAQVAAEAARARRGEHVLRVTRGERPASAPARTPDLTPAA